MAILVERDQPIGHGQNGVGRTVILFKANHLGFRPVILEVQNVAYLGASPSVNGLVIVTDHAKISMVLRESLDNFVLSPVGVLVLIDKHMVVTPRLHTPDIFVFGQELFGTDEQIIEIKRCL